MQTVRSNLRIFNGLLVCLVAYIDSILSSQTQTLKGQKPKLASRGKQFTGTILQRNTEHCNFELL